jgi:adenylate kinase
VVLGKQGAGKGTQCVRLSHHYVVPHVSTGDMLRGEVKSRTPLGLRARSAMDRGELLPDDLIMEMVGRRVTEGDTRARGFILDGCPRTIAQAKELERLLDPDPLDLVIDLEVPTPQVLKRLASRRVCVDCGSNYSVPSPPLTNWTCDVCGGEVIQREDDTEEAISRRLDLYERQTAPLIEWYTKRGVLVKINGSGSPDVVTRRSVKAIEERRGGRGAGEPVAGEGATASQPGLGVMPVAEQAGETPPPTPPPAGPWTGS